MHTAVSQPPPERPELPEGVDPEPRWPAWYALAAFGVGLFATFIAVAIVAAITGTTSGEDNATFTIVATLLQSLAFIGAAGLFASFTARPRARDLGLRR